MNTIRSLIKFSFLVIYIYCANILIELKQISDLFGEITISIPTRKQNIYLQNLFCQLQYII